MLTQSESLPFPIATDHHDDDARKPFPVALILALAAICWAPIIWAVSFLL